MPWRPTSIHTQQYKCISGSYLLAYPNPKCYRHLNICKWNFCSQNWMGLHAADVLADGKAEHWSGSWQGKSQFDHIVAHLHLLLQLEFQPLLCNKDSCNSHMPKLADIGEGVLVKKLKEYDLYNFSQVLDVPITQATTSMNTHSCDHWSHRSTSRNRLLNLLV